MISLSKVFFAVMLFGSTATWANVTPLKTMSQDGFRAKFNLENPQKPGICIEIIRAIEKLDPKLKFSGLEAKGSTARVETELANGAIDVFFGLIKTPEREAKFNWVPIPLFVNSQVLVARKNDSFTFNNWDDLRRLGKNGTILVNRSSAQSQYLRSLGGLEIDDQSIHVSANLRKLLSERARVYYVSDLYVLEEIEAQGLSKDLKILPPRFEREALYVFFSKKILVADINRVTNALKELEKNGELARIRKRYAHIKK